MYNYKQKLPDLLYYFLLIIYIIGGITAIVISFKFNFNREDIGFAMLIGALLVFFITKNKDKLSTNLKPRLFKVLSLIFIILAVLSIFVSVYSQKNYYLPIEYFILIALTGSVVMIQILYPKNLSETQKYVILTQIFILSAIVSASFLFLFPGPIGDDSSFHVTFINYILNSGHTDFIGGFANYQYSSYPVYHLFYVLLIKITGINDIKIIQFILALIQILFLSFIYLLVDKFFKEKIALLSVLLISFFPYIVQSQFNFFPSSFSVIFFILGLYLTFNSLTKEFALLYIISFIIINFSHPFTPMFFIVISLLILVIYKLLNDKLKLNKFNLSINAIILMVILMLIWWMKPTTNIDLFTRFIDTINEALGSVSPSNASHATTTTAYSFQNLFLYDLGLVLLIMLAIFGSMYSIKYLKKHSNLKSLIMGTSLKVDQGIILLIITLLVIPIPYVLTIVYPNSLPERWFPFIGIFIGISGAVGLYTLKNSSLFSNKLKYVPILLMFFILFFSITTPMINPNAQIYSEKLANRAALTTSEIYSVDFVNSNYNFKDIRGNSRYLDLIINQDINENSYINPEDSSTYSGNLIVVRNYDFKKGFTIPFYNGNSFKNFYPTKEFSEYLEKSNEIYNNGDLSMHI